MSTTGVTTWAVDLKDVGAIYPFQGTETLLLILGLAVWLGWHVWSIRWEKAYHREKIAKYGDAETLRKSLEQP
jgi:hypothetical protein